MNSRAWALAATIALLLGTPASIAENDDSSNLLPAGLPTEALDDACVDMLKVTMVSFGGHLTKGNLESLNLLTTLNGELHRTTTTVTQLIDFVQVFDSANLLGDVVATLEPVVVGTVETTETTVEQVIQAGAINTKFRVDTVDWERIERSILVPLPADIPDGAEISSSCEDTQVEMLYHGDYDVIDPMWYPEAMAPSTYGQEEYVSILEFDFTTVLDPAEEYIEWDQGIEIAGNAVFNALCQELAQYDYIFEELNTVINPVYPDEGEEEEAPEEEAEASADSVPGPSSSQISLAGGLGVAGLLGSVLAFRRF